MINVTEWMKILVVLTISINNTLIYKRLCVFITISNSRFDGNTNYRLVTIVHTLKLPQKDSFPLIIQIDNIVNEDLRREEQNIIDKKGLRFNPDWR